MRLVITSIKDRSDKVELDVTGIEINPIDNKLLFIETGKENTIGQMLLETTKTYFISVVPETYFKKEG